MKLSDYKRSRINNMMKNDRLAYKAKENASKPPLVSADVLETSDFTFAKFMIDRVGDSGQLLLAKRKTDRSEQYLVKHAFTDCAANEFVYTKLAQTMGYHMPDAKLFRLSSGEKRSYFKTEYIIGEQFLSLIDDDPSFETIQNQASNWQDIFGFYAMENMFSEGDGIEVVLAADGLLYRIDTTSSFAVSNWDLDYAGIDIECQGKNINDAVRGRLLSRTFDASLHANSFDWHLKYYKEHYGDVCVEPYLQPFMRVQQISNEYIDRILNTLCYFYPDYIGDYYKKYISALQKAAAEFLALVV